MAGKTKAHHNKPQSEKVLVGDIGGTNVRFALAERTPSGALALHKSKKLSVADYANFESAAKNYLSGLRVKPTRGAFAFAGAMNNRTIRMTNTPWVVSEDSLVSELGLKEAVLCNDFVALARGAMVIPDEGLKPVISGKLDCSQNIAVLGPGTGLGTSCVLPHPQCRPDIVIATEGGHTAFSPVTKIEREILEQMSESLSFVSFESILSGPGFFRLYMALCAIRDETPVCENETEIIAAGIANETSAARRCIDVFCNILGTYTGNAVLALGAFGGVVIGGGVAQHIEPFLAGSDFDAHFRNRGVGGRFLQNVPVKIIMADFTALYGAASRLV